MMRLLWSTCHEHARNTFISINESFECPRERNTSKSGISNQERGRVSRVMATDAAADDFVTIVPVGEGRPPAPDPSFVTVLTVGAAAGAAEVTVRRPRGERLGLGLKFEGGSAAAEKVRRLLVQSCAENSPAANARAPWGKLIPGDEILAIDGESVSNLTRIDCVRRLKDSDESLSLLVRHFESGIKTEKTNMDVVDAVTNSKPPSEIVRPTTLPPPVPPRKLGKKNSFKDKQSHHTVGEQNLPNNDSQLENLLNGKHNGINTITKLSRKSSFDSHIHRQAKESIAYLKKGSPEEVRRLVRRLSDGKAMPPEAEVYIDLLSTEWERCLLLADAESDDTGSSISTVVDRLGSMTSSGENSVPSTPTMQPKTIDIQKVLNCIENIDTNILKDMTSKRFLEKQTDLNSEFKLTEKNCIANGHNNHDITTENLFTSEEVSKKILHNDKNNNNTIVTSNIETNKVSQTKKVDNKSDIAAEKPKPMPRNTKVERIEKKARPIPVPEMAPPPIPEQLLTPTKKNCIESWLQRSEAEMNNSKTEKLEENSVPEILPRLIDFLPKNPFKDSSSDPPLTRPTTAPPPPPTEAREDGSGASLDTIGELDESTDVTDSIKPVEVNEKKERKSSFERSFWEDRINKSDAEDKSLSNDETPLPSCPRQPPDGVETPCDVVEKTPEPTTRPPRLPSGWPGTRPRLSYTSRSQDARSEASVKDKIAMFSNDRATSSDRIDKCGTLPARNHSTVRKSTAPYMKSYSDVSSLDRRLTKSQDNLDELPRSYKRPTERPEVLGGVERVPSTPTYSSVKTINSPLYTESKPLFYGSTTTLPSATDASFAKTIYHTRSVSDDNGNKKTTNHKSNLEYLIEQRKKSMSKLRGLVIPEVQTPIVDLPEIKVQDNISKSYLLKSNQNNTNSKVNKTNSTKPVILNETKWKADLLPNNLPKYSPAFKRKSLQVYSPTALSKESTPEPVFHDRIESLNKMNYQSNGTRVSRTSVEPYGLTNRYKASTLGSPKTLGLDIMNLSRKEPKDVLNYVRECKNFDVKVCTATDVIDSDNDSAMSSTQSSYRSSASSPMHTIETIESDSSRLSPRASHYAPYSIFRTEITNKGGITEKSGEEYMKRNVCRSVSSDTNVSLSSSAGSAATSGSQASCSSLESSVADSDKRKVSKTYNIDTINRRNILASAKCRSGRDAKLKSPVVETKFSQESCNRSPSPVHKTSERLSTLTSSVSAMSNKGENRRRNKIIAETDSDSDSDVNTWQRKNEYKNSRLKRNSSSANKNKQNDTNLESPKIDEGPKIISEKIIKEIKKAGLDNYKNSKTTNAVEIKEIVIKSDLVLPNKQEINKVELIGNHKPVGRINENSQNNEKSFELSKKIEIELTSDNKKNGSTVEAKVPTQVIRLRRGAGTGVGVILAGGIDCEAKDVTVHRVLSDSVAAKAGLKRGAKVKSINGRVMTGLTHAQSVTILKEQRAEVLIEIEVENRQTANGVGCGSEKAESKARNGGDTVDLGHESSATGSAVTVLLEKAGGGAGLGFGLDGGRDSPRGDRPLTIKKLFAGGAAAQSGRILVGAELLSAGGQSMEGFTRTQAWAALKALPAGPVTLVLRNPKGNKDT